MWLLTLMTTIGGIFWFSELRFHLPTPIPAGYQAVSTGTRIDLGRVFNDQPHKPVLIHFFNPACPCSRFNINVFAGLVHNYASRVNFAVVLVSPGNRYSASEFEARYGLHVQVITDTSLARRCGVYATPQAVVLDEHHQLYYRGNYNQSRYCTNEQTSYARLALDSVLMHSGRAQFETLATRSYGCSLSTCLNPAKP